MNPLHSLPFALLLAGLAPAFSSDAAQPLPGPGYVLLFEDNFDGDAVNEAVWDYRVGRRGGEDPAAGWIDAMNLKENVTVKDGMMVIRHAREKLNGKMENTCGGLISRKRFGYGYYESRYKPFMIATPGTHAAFWQRGVPPTKEGGDPTRPVANTVFEIDSSELSSPHWRGTNNLYPALGNKSFGPIPWIHRMTVPIKPDAEGFIVDAFESRPDGIIFYDNGKEVSRTAWNMLSAQQEVWLTSLAGAHWRYMDASLLPGDALFDYFRYYARDWPGENLLGNSQFQYNTDMIDLQTPVCWFESGDVEASAVAPGKSGGKPFLRHSAEKDYKVTTSQTLQHIIDGDYTASAMVRSSGGQRVARFRVFDNGAEEKSVDIPVTGEWTRVEIPKVSVKGNAATIGFESDAKAGQWLEVDEVAFMKPAVAGTKVAQRVPFEIPGEPPWEIFQGAMQSFADGRNYLFSRNLGQGDAISAALTIQPSRFAEQVPIERFPATGDGGWSVKLTESGDLVFQIGSAASHTDLVVPKAYEPGKATHVAVVFDKGVASVYLDGKLAARKEGVEKKTDDKATPGTLGVYWTRNDQRQSYDGAMGDVRVYNRALDAAEVQALAAAAYKPVAPAAP